MGAGSASTTRTMMPQLPSIAVTLVSPKAPISSWVRSMLSAWPGSRTSTAQSWGSPNFSTWGLQPSATFRTLSLNVGPGSAPLTRIRAMSGFWITEATSAPSLKMPFRTVSSPMSSPPLHLSASEWYHRIVRLAPFFVLGLASFIILLGVCPTPPADPPRPPPVSARPQHDFRGIIHCHSKYSHDSKGTYEEILAAAKAAKVDFICMTDHPPKDDKGLPLREGWTGLHDGVLFIQGAEY